MRLEVLRTTSDERKEAIGPDRPDGSKRVRVVHYISKFTPQHWGGAEEAIYHLAVELARFGFDSEVWATEVLGGDPKESVGDLEVRRFYGYYFSRKERAQAGIGKTAISLKLMRALWKERRSIDLVHVHGHNRGASLVVGLAKMAHLPVVLSFHSKFLSMRPQWRFWFPNEFAARTASRIVVVNPAIGSALRSAGVDGAKIITIPNGISARSFEHGEAGRFRDRLGIGDAPLILTVGRICSVKNQRVALEALPRVHESLPNAHWAVIGFPSEEDYYERLRADISRLGLEDSIHVIPGLPPRSPELADAYSAADVAVIPSLREAFPLVVLEAWASGTPVVASAADGLKDMIVDGETGLLVGLGTDQAPGAIVSSLTDKLIRQRLIDNGLSEVGNFEWSSIAERYVPVYEDVLASAPSSPSPQP